MDNHQAETIKRILLKQVAHRLPILVECKTVTVISLLVLVIAIPLGALWFDSKNSEIRECNVQFEAANEDIRGLQMRVYSLERELDVHNEKYQSLLAVIQT